MIRAYLFSFMLIGTLFACFPCSLQAQMFGQRSLGGTLRPQPRPGQAAAAAAETATGEIEGSERFLRGNRSRRDFVGSDRREQAGFVGSQQALGAGRVVAATESLQAEADPTARVNPPLPALPPKAMYYPRLKLDANSFASLGTAIRQARLEAMNSSIDSMKGVIALPPADKYRITPEKRVTSLSNGSVQLTRSGDQAILTGTVSSVEEAERLAILMSFEPGIYEVVNQLTVTP
jgi:hypothetical protein